MPFSEILSGTPPGIFLGTPSGVFREFFKNHLVTGPRVSSEIPYKSHPGFFIKDSIGKFFKDCYICPCLFSTISWAFFFQSFLKEFLQKYYKIFARSFSLGFLRKCFLKFPGIFPNVFSNDTISGVFFCNDSEILARIPRGVFSRNSLPATFSVVIVVWFSPEVCLGIISFIQGFSWAFI